MTWREKLVARGLRTSRKGANGDRQVQLARRCFARRTQHSRAAEAYMEHGGIRFAVPLYNLALKYHRKGERLMGWTPIPEPMGVSE